MNIYTVFGIKYFVTNRTVMLLWLFQMNNFIMVSHRLHRLKHPFTFITLNSTSAVITVLCSNMIILVFKPIKYFVTHMTS